jgi:threonine dehydrogenase-like Zn-dependent dehydrogenase
MEEALPLLEHALIPVEQMIAARFPLRDAPHAFAHAAQKGVLKVLLEG